MQLSKQKSLKVALVVIGLFFIFGLFPLMQFWPSAWTWEPRHYEYEQMIMGIYATLGVFLLWASLNPEGHRSLIWFTIWSSFVHGAIMLVQALDNPAVYGNYYGDIPGLFLIAIVLWFLMSKKAS